MLLMWYITVLFELQMTHPAVIVRSLCHIMSHRPCMHGTFIRKLKNNESNYVT